MAEEINKPKLPEIRQVPALNAWTWTVKGFELFRENPAMLIILLLIYLAIIIPISLLPVVGSVLSALVAPIFSAGLMWGCQALYKKQDLEINHLFEGFKHNTSQLIAIGGFYMLSLLIIAIFVVMSLDKPTIELLMKGKNVSPEQANAMMLPILMAMLLLVPVLMAYWFAPVLASLNNLNALEAMKLSFKACVKNFLPFFLYSVIFMVLLIIALIPAGLGLIVVMPLLMTSLYISYVDIFNIDVAETVNTEDELI